jgi:hypothetical protein
MTLTRPPQAPPPPRPSAPPRVDSWEPTRTRSTWFHWRMLLRPFQSREQGTMPAGMVLVVVVIGLLVAGVLNADATLRKSNAKGEGWRNELAHVAASVSGTLGLTTPRDMVDDVLGKNQSSDIDVAELLAQQQDEPQIDPALEAAEAEAARLEALRPKLPPATPEAPLDVYIGGDSLVRNFGMALQKVATTSGVLSAELDSRPATGLSRPDFFNWPEHLVRDIVPKDPQIVVLQFGPNDAQGFTIEGRAVNRFTPEWMAEYRRRVGATMDLLRSPTAQRLVVWVGAPIMGPGSGVSGMEQVNQIYYEEAQARPWVTYFDTWPFLTDANLNYVERAPAADGSMTSLREPDKIHVTMAGGARIAWGVLDRIGEMVDLTAGNITPPPSEAAPPEVEARTELPPPPPL